MNVTRRKVAPDKVNDIRAGDAFRVIHKRVVANPDGQTYTVKVTLRQLERKS